MKNIKKTLIFVLTSALLTSGLAMGSSAGYLVAGASGGGNGISSNCVSPDTQSSKCTTGSDLNSVLGNQYSFCPSGKTSGNVKVIIGNSSGSASVNQTIQSYLDAAEQNANCNTQNQAAGNSSTCPTQSASSCPTSGSTVSAASDKTAVSNSGPAESAAKTETAVKAEAAATDDTSAAAAITENSGTAPAATGNTSSCNTAGATSGSDASSSQTADSGWMVSLNNLLKKCGIDLSKLGINLPGCGDTTAAAPTQSSGGTEDTASSSDGTAATPADHSDTQTTPANTQSGTAGSKAADNLAFEKQVVALVNEQRAANGLAPLTLSTELSNAARTKSQDMHDNNYFAHESPTYGSPFEMLTSFGISYRSAGENIAMGYSTPEAVMNAWMNSSGHRANILNASYTQIGVGYVADGNYWTQEFIG